MLITRLQLLEIHSIEAKCDRSLGSSLFIPHQYILLLEITLLTCLSNFKIIFYFFNHQTCASMHLKLTTSIFFFFKSLFFNLIKFPMKNRVKKFRLQVKNKNPLFDMCKNVIPFNCHIFFDTFRIVTVFFFFFIFV